MRETQFISENQEKWQEFEKSLNQNNADPEKLSQLFIQITDDLSHARTFYPNRSVRVYLNSLAQRIFFRIYKSPQRSANRLITFWTHELPMVIHESRSAFRLSFFVFTIALLIGMLSSAMDPGFANIVLGDSYVNMTLENISSGDPMKVYKQKGAFNMFLGITLNNLMVALRTFIFGAFFIIGSLVFLIENGVMVGTFQYFFIERNLFLESFLTIWIHGTLEISAIIIAGAAGITMGRGLVFPGTYTRIQSFQLSAKRGLKIMIGIVPIIILAGFFEGFLTRATETPDFIRLLFILSSLAFVLGYYVWYPWRKGKQVKDKDASNQIIFQSDPPIDTENIITNNQIFANIFKIYRENFGLILRYSFLSAIVFFGLVIFISGKAPLDLFSYSSYQPNIIFDLSGRLDPYFTKITWRWMPVFTIIMISFFSWFIIQLTRQNAVPNKPESMGLKVLHFLKVFLGVVVYFWMLTFDAVGFRLVALFFYFACLLWIFIMVEENRNPVSAMTRFWELSRFGFIKTVRLWLVLIMISILLFRLSDMGLTWFFVGILEYVISLEELAMDQLSTMVVNLINLIAFLLLQGIIVAGIGLIYYSLKEMADAKTLKQEIQNLGNRQFLRGIERES